MGIGCRLVVLGLSGMRLEHQHSRDTLTDYGRLYRRALAVRRQRALARRLHQTPSAGAMALPISRLTWQMVGQTRYRSRDGAPCHPQTQGTEGILSARMLRTIEAAKRPGRVRYATSAVEQGAGASVPDPWRFRRPQSLPRPKGIL